MSSLPPPPPSLPMLSTLFPSSNPENRGVLSRLASLLIRRTSSSYTPTTSINTSFSTTATTSLPTLLVLPAQPTSHPDLLTYLSALSQREVQFSFELSSATTSERRRKGLNATIGCDYLRAFNTIVSLLCERDEELQKILEVEISKLRSASILSLQLAIHHRAMAWSLSSFSSSSNGEEEEEMKRRLKLLDFGIVGLMLDENIDFITGETLSMVRTEIEISPGSEGQWNQLPKAIKNTLQGVTSHIHSHAHHESSTGSINPTSLHTLLISLSDSLSNLSSTNSPAILEGIQPNIDPEILFDWMKLKVGIKRVAVGLGVVSRGMKGGKGESVKEELLELGDHDDVVVQEDQEDEGITIKEEERKDIKPFKSSPQAFSPASRRSLSTTPTAFTFNTTTDPAIDLLHVLHVIDSLIVRQENSPYGAAPDNMRVLVKRRPWIVRKRHDEIEITEDSEDEDDEITSSEEAVEDSDADKEGELETGTGGVGDETGTRPRDKLSANVEAPQPILTSLFTLYDRYVEQQRAVWMDLPAPKMKCDRFTENGEVGAVWRKVVGRLAFGVLGPVTMLAHGMDEDQLYRWQQEEDDALRARKRRRTSKA